MKTAAAFCCTAAVVLLMPVAWSQTKPAPPRRYAITDLGGLKWNRGDGPVSDVGINNKGQVVGEIFLETRKPRMRSTFIAFQWENGSRHELPMLAASLSAGARSVNDAGVVAGQSSLPQKPTLLENVMRRFTKGVAHESHAVVWEKGRVRSLGTLPGMEWSHAVAVNNRGQVIGLSGRRAADVRAFLWQNGTMMDLGRDRFYANGINDRGQVVGASYGGGTAHALLWVAGKLRPLGTLPGAKNTTANAINNRGQIIGSADLPGSSGERHAVLWSNGAIRDLGALPGTTQAVAKAINNGGQIVGEAYVFDKARRVLVNRRAFLWDGAMHDLNQQIPSNSGWVLGGATGINERGQIVGWGTFQGTTHYFLLTPH